MAQRHKGQAQFYFVYIREGHKMLPVMRNGIIAIDKIEEARDFAERCQRARTCGTNLGLSVLGDGADNAAGAAYAAWPQRVYVIGLDGLITFKGRSGTMTGQDLPLALDRLPAPGGLD